MKLQIEKTLFAFAAATVLTVGGSTGLASSFASRDFPGYWRVVRNGQELFCDKEKDGHFLRAVCYSRNQVEERERTVLVLDSGPVLIPQTAQFIAAGRPGG